MKNIFVICAFLIAGLMQGQNDEAFVDELVQQFKQKLTERSITDFYTVKRYCSGKIEMFQIGKERKMCSSKGTYYMVFVVWKEEGVARIKKIDNCGLFYTVPLANTELYAFFDQNRSALASETIKQYKSASYTGKPELRKQPQPCYRSFAFTMNGVTSEVSYNLFDISKPEDNTNYEYNNSRKAVELDAKLDAILAQKEAGMKRQI